MTAAIIVRQDRIMKLHSLMKTHALNSTALSDMQILYLDYMLTLCPFEPDLSDDEKVEVAVAFHKAYRAVDSLRGDVGRLADINLPGRAIVATIITAYKADLNRVASTTRQAVIEARTRNRIAQIVEIALQRPDILAIANGSPAHAVAIKVIEMYPTSIDIKDAVAKARAALDAKFREERHKAIAFGCGHAKQALYSAELEMKGIVNDEIRLIQEADSAARRIMASLL